MSGRHCNETWPYLFSVSLCYFVIYWKITIQRKYYVSFTFKYLRLRDFFFFLKTSKIFISEVDDNKIKKKIMELSMNTNKCWSSSVGTDAPQGGESKPYATIWNVRNASSGLVASTEMQHRKSSAKITLKWPWRRRTSISASRATRKMVETCPGQQNLQCCNCQYPVWDPPASAACPARQGKIRVKCHLPTHYPETNCFLFIFSV